MVTPRPQTHAEGLARGDSVVCIAVEGSAAEALHECRQSVLAHTPSDIPTVVVESGDDGLARTLATLAPADVVVLMANGAVGPGWYEDLRDAAYSSSRVSSATNTAGATYLRRDALELTGGIDPKLPASAAALADYAERCLARGLAPITTAKPMVAGGGTAPPIGSAGNGTLSVTIDARCLVAPVNGTRVIVLETIRALAASDSARVRVIAPERLADWARDALAGLDVSFVTEANARTGLTLSDIAHRPFQVASAADVQLLAGVGSRTVVSQLDLIGFDNPTYFPTRRHWDRYRALTRLTLGIADRAIFISHDSADEALAEQLVDPARAVVVYPGVTGIDLTAPQPLPPAGIGALSDRPFIAMIGSDYHHKNRVFAIKLLAAMRDQHDWPGALVLAGVTVADGSSAAEEARLLADDPALAGAVLRLPAVSPAEKAWLLANCVATCYPSTREGFGLVPFEAAAYGRPCIFASTSSLSELHAADLATITQWNAHESAARVLTLLGDPARIAEHVNQINARAADLTWQASAERLIEVYNDARAAPQRVATRRLDLLELEVAGPFDAETQRALVIVARRRQLQRVILLLSRLWQRFKPS